MLKIPDFYQYYTKLQIVNIIWRSSPMLDTLMSHSQSCNQEKMDEILGVGWSHKFDGTAGERVGRCLVAY